MNRDTTWQREFEEMFPYDETDDQLKAIEDTKHDMESSKIMDRLICGDVGYGKTEVAIRAAFKAVQERQAGGVSGAYHDPGPAALQYLCPADEGLSRCGCDTDLPFPDTAAAEKNRGRICKKGLGGYCDRNPSDLLSKDVEFKDLGLFDHR